MDHIEEQYPYGHPEMGVPIYVTSYNLPII